MSLYDAPIEPIQHEHWYVPTNIQGNYMQEMTVDQLNALEGQITPEDVERLIWLGQQVPEKGVVVEIGCYMGKSTACLLSGMPESAKLYAIDPWCLLNSQKYGTYATMNKFRDQIAPWANQVTQIVGWPVDVASIWSRPIDLFSVDCTKTYEELAPIWQAWIGFCKDWIASHDYDIRPQSSQYYPGVHQVLEEICFPITKNQHHISYTWSGQIK